MDRPRTIEAALERSPVVRSDGTVERHEARAVQARAAAGELVRLVPGAWTSASTWGSLWPYQQHALRVVASMPRRSRPDLVVSHVSAAALKGWSIDASYPERVHLTAPGVTTASANRTFVVHGGGPDAIPTVTRVGVPMTPPARTAVDCARSMAFREGVCIVDQALRDGVRREDLFAQLDAGGRSTKARAVIEFGDGAAANIGETLFRLLFRSLGLPSPVLQHEFRDRDRRAFVDFWFPDAGVVVEFDGHGKYREDRFRGGRSPGQVVVDEKIREDWLRDRPGVNRVVRFGWADRLDAEGVRVRMANAGVVAVRSARGLRIGGR